MLSWCRHRRLSLFVIAVGVCLAGAMARGQVVNVASWRSGIATLNEGWLEQGGDNLAWAKPDFDDSGWEKISLDEIGPAPTGWTWYRIHLKVGEDHQGLNLLIAGGEGTYELYVDGRKVEAAQIKTVLAVSRPTEQVFDLSDIGDGEVVIAVRMYVTPMYTGWHLPAFLTVALGTPDPIENERTVLQSARLYGAIPSIAINLLVMIAGIGAFALFRSQRGHREYLWLAAYLLLLGVSNGLLYISTLGLIPLAWNNLLADPLIYVIMILQIRFTFSFAGRRPGRIWLGYQIVLLLSVLVNPFAVIAGWIPANDYLWFETVVISPAALLLPVLLTVWYRRGNSEAGWLIVPSILPAAATAAINIGTASILTGYGKLDFLTNPIPIGPAFLQLTDVCDFLFVLAIGVVMFFRFTSVSREQTRVAAELEAAREIQQRLVPAQLPRVKGYAIDAAYYPAQEVGGDFYQIFEQDDGSQLIVVGDVSGKGLKAAMTGTLALGALHTLADEGLGPAAVLMRLNRQLAETHDGGFITCVCAQLREHGELTIANAGHLPPYRNGEELEVPADLPLGISGAEVYEERRFHLEPGDRLTLLSDGVLEARDTHGVLFGFERTRAISGQTAYNIAQAARDHGQQDDITVLTLALSPVAMGHT
jgi:phosphoserine phosphatase RsbU/P